VNDPTTPFKRGGGRVHCKGKDCLWWTVLWCRLPGGCGAIDFDFPTIEPRSIESLDLDLASIVDGFYLTRSIGKNN
jgi:hypothetical protein